MILRRGIMFRGEMSCVVCLEIGGVVLVLRRFVVGDFFWVER